VVDRVARFFSTQYTKTGKDIPNYQKITKRLYNIQIPKWHKIYQHFPFQDPSKFTQFGIFGLKTYHLATLAVE
jgi:hypothetical protein